MPDVVVFIQSDDRAVHPAFKFGDESKAGVGMAEQGINNGVFKNQVGFKEQRIVLKQVFLGQVQGINIVGAGVQGIVHITGVEMSSRERKVLSFSPS